jgi:hypothetical protein
MELKQFSSVFQDLLKIVHDFSLISYFTGKMENALGTKVYSPRSSKGCNVTDNLHFSDYVALPVIN